MYMYGTPSFENTYIDAFTSAPVHILVIICYWCQTKNF